MACSQSLFRFLCTLLIAATLCDASLKRKATDPLLRPPTRRRGGDWYEQNFIESTKTIIETPGMKLRHRAAPVDRNAVHPTKKRKARQPKIVVVPAPAPAAASTSGSETERHPSEETIEMKTETLDDPTVSSPERSPQPDADYYDVDVSDAELAAIFENVNEHIGELLERCSPEGSSSPDYNILEDFTEHFMDVQAAQEQLARELAPARIVYPVLEESGVEEPGVNEYASINSHEDFYNWPHSMPLAEQDPISVNPLYTKLLDFQNVHSRFHIENDHFPMTLMGDRIPIEDTGDSWFTI